MQPGPHHTTGSPGATMKLALYGPTIAIGFINFSSRKHHDACVYDEVGVMQIEMSTF